MKKIEIFGIAFLIIILISFVSLYFYRTMKDEAEEKIQAEQQVVNVSETLQNATSSDATNFSEKTFTIVTPSHHTAKMFVTLCDVSNACFGSGAVAIGSSTEQASFYGLVSRPNEERVGILTKEDRAYQVWFDMGENIPTDEDYKFFDTTAFNLLNYGLIK